MALELDGRQRRALREALLDAFPTWGDLGMMVSDQLDERLATIAAESRNLELVANELIDWARSRGRSADLVVGARNSNPDNPRLFVVAQHLGLTSTDASKSVLEKLISGNTTFLDVAVWRAALTRIEWKVCRIDRDGRGCGTGFLVGPDAVLTNYHVVEPAIDLPELAASYSCRFDYKVSEEGSIVSSGTVAGLAGADWLIDASPYSPVDTVPGPSSIDPGDDELDHALLRLDTPLGESAVGAAADAEPRAWLPFDATPVDFGSIRSIAILQHPETLPLKLAIGTGEQIAVNGAGNRIRYEVPTLPGSSGAPIFDADWRLIGLHHSGDPRIDDPEYNEGIPLSPIATRPAVAAYLQELEDEEW